MSEDKILVAIPVVNLWDEYTIHAMESIAASKHETPFDVLIVDNASTDMTVEKAHDFGNRKMPGRVFVKHFDSNQGCAAGWNAGVTFGLENNYSHIVIANNDILVGPGMIQALYNRMKREPKKLLVSAVDVIKELVVPQQVLDGDHAVNKKEDTEAPHPNFSCFMITPETIEVVGWFDESFYPAYFEDNDYHYRIKIGAGADAAIANTTAVFIHYGSRTQNQASNGPIVPGETFRKNEEYFIRKWGGSPTHEKFVKPFNSDSNDHKYAKHG